MFSLVWSNLKQFAFVFSSVFRLINLFLRVMPQNCSSSLNSVIRRCDNKISFARQASSEQGFFMRQASTDEVPKNPQNGGISLKNSVIRRGDHNRLYFARQASSAQGFFMRQAGEVPSIPSFKSLLVWWLQLQMMILYLYSRKLFQNVFAEDHTTRHCIYQVLCDQNEWLPFFFTRTITFQTWVRPATVF